jgi:hypothetical protein
MKEVQGNHKGLKMNGTQQLAFYTDGASLLRNNVMSIFMIGVPHQILFG